MKKISEEDRRALRGCDMLANGSEPKQIEANVFGVPSPLEIAIIHKLCFTSFTEVITVANPFETAL